MVADLTVTTVETNTRGNSELETSHTHETNLQHLLT